MQRLALPLLAIVLTSLPGTLARAAEACEACRQDDEQQIGSYVEPDVQIPPVTRHPDARGQAVNVPTPVGPATVHVKPGDGVWLGSPGEGRGNVFLSGKKDKASVGWKLGF